MKLLKQEHESSDSQSPPCQLHMNSRMGRTTHPPTEAEPQEDPEEIENRLGWGTESLLLPSIPTLPLRSL